MRRGGGVGIFVSNALDSEPQVYGVKDKGVDFVDEQFENVVVKLPKCLPKCQPNPE